MNSAERHLYGSLVMGEKDTQINDSMAAADQTLGQDFESKTQQKEKSFLARQKLKSLFDSSGVKGKSDIEILDDGLEEL